MTRYKFWLLLTFISEECFFFAIAAAVVAAGGMFMQYQASQDAAKQAEYDSEYEAELSENQAEQEKLNRAAAQKNQHTQLARRRAAQRASYAKSGVLLEGTPLTMLAEQAGTDEQNLQQGNLDSRQRRTNLRAGGQAALQSGKNRASAYRYAGNATLLTSIGKGMMSGVQSGNWWDKNGSSDSSSDSGSSD